MLYRELARGSIFNAETVEYFNHDPLPEPILNDDFWVFRHIQFRSDLSAQFNALPEIEKQKFSVFIARQIARRFPDILVWTKFIPNPIMYVPVDILSQPAEFFLQTDEDIGLNGAEIEIHFTRKGQNWWEGSIINITALGYGDPVFNTDDVVYYAGHAPGRMDKMMANEILGDLDTIIMDLLDLRFNRYPQYQILYQNTSFLQMLKSVAESERDLEPNFEGVITRTRDRTLTEAEKNKRRREAMMIFLLQQSTIPREITSQFPFPGSPQEFLNGLRNV